MSYLSHIDLNERAVTPNDFQGSDSQRIQAAIDYASSGRGEIFIPRINAKTGQPLWVLDSAILLPSNLTVILDNCTLKLSDNSRDNFFRTSNCGLGITSFTEYNNVKIIGVGTATLQGADNPRATGDTNKPLSLTPTPFSTQSYGTDAGVSGQTQTGDWRNIGILLAYTSNFLIENIKIVDPHCWAISLERCTNGRIGNIDYSSNGTKIINGNSVYVTNQDGIDLRYGCNNIIIENITGQTGDDCVALTIIELSETPGIFGTMHVTGVSTPIITDNISFVVIKNIKCFSDKHIVLLLNTGATYEITDISIDTVIDNSGITPVADAAILIGATGYGGIAPLGHTSRIFINNLVSRASKTISVIGSLSESIITNIMRYQAISSPGTVLFYSNIANIRNVNTSNIYDYT